MKTGMRNPVHVCVRRKAEEGQKPPASGDGAAAGDTGGASTRHEVPTKLQNFYIGLAAPQKLAFLKDFLEMPEVRRGKTIVFFLTCACVDYFHGLLRELLEGQESEPGKKGKKRQKNAKPRSSKDCRIEKLHGQMDPTA